MDLDRLQEFILLAEARSFKAAAEQLGVSPNVLSTRFSSFESALGTVLIERNAHKFALTQSGRSLLRDAREILSGYEHTLASMKSIHGDSFRSLRLQLCGQTMPMELGPFLDLYCRKYPTLFLDIYDENSHKIREGLQSSQVDMAFAVGRADDFQDIPVHTKLNAYPFVKVLVPIDHRLAKRNTIRFEELSGETFILYPEMKETCTRELQRSILEQAGISYTVYEEHSSPFFYSLLVPIGKGISFWIWNDHNRIPPNSALLTVTDPGFETYLFMLYRDDTENETVRHFSRDFLAFREARE